MRTIPSNNLNQSALPTKRCAFKTRMSSLKPVASLDLPTDGRAGSTRLHLSNLERLLWDRQEVIGNRHEGVSVAKKGKGVLDFLDFARIWKDTATEEEHGCVDCLRRLLSTSNEYSPRSGLGERWREYHGGDDWAGMLDPLDENLRREVVRYGEFVQAAYRDFQSSPTTLSEEEERRTLRSSARHLVAVDRSYRVTRSLYATSTIGLPGWLDELAPDLGWLTTQRSSRIGYVAVCDDQGEIQRMGRRDIVIVLRGTVTCLEWAENFRANLVPVLDQSREASTVSGELPEVECGFLNLFKTRGVHIPSLSESIIREVTSLVETYKDEMLSITVTGHSLGAALSILIADELSSVLATPAPVAVFSFGGPKVGNRAFGDRIRVRNVKVLRIVNSQDIITRVPVGLSLDEQTRGKLRKLARIEVRTPWDGYSHVGTELRLDTRMSPYLRPDADIACCHDLEAYLHLVDGFLSSSCPFRSNAKRSLARLVSEQRSNVKRLYTRKVERFIGENGQPRTTRSILVQ